MVLPKVLTHLSTVELHKILRLLKLVYGFKNYISCMYFVQTNVLHVCVGFGLLAHLTRDLSKAEKKINVVIS